jgi:spermidine dehydrogenase
MTYKQFLEEQLRLSPAVTAYADPILAAAMGLGCDALSAYGTLSIQMPGVKAYAGPTARYPRLESFPGGNDGFVRHYVKTLVPEAVPGETLADVLLQPVVASALDRVGAPVRLRLAASVVWVEHEGDPARASAVRVVYVKNGRAHSVRARAVVMATGSWIGRKAVRDLPQAHAEAMAEFHHSAVLVANVALTNWRFLHKLGITACRYPEGEFGFSCNIRRPMAVGDKQPPLEPDAPTVLTFYVPFYYPGRPLAEQGTAGRLALLTTPFADYERRIRAQMTRLFGGAGFDARRDIAGIVLNRWGHAYVNPQPGFYFGREGQKAPRDVLRERHGRIAFGHSELEGHQNWPGAVRNGARAARQVLDFA